MENMPVYISFESTPVTISGICPGHKYKPGPLYTHKGDPGRQNNRRKQSIHPAQSAFSI